ncbi:hypothetical protein QW71_34185 [Paenibacillus sp. IHB B 3415]|uniref:hypothetical protein n=1 Tax=Paenibacillus sp. IHB B 3415 TaxID=867080 RepID=UPI000574F9A8|nr:hypothetical protein [Paenibacillus sp. IHB B 3415]KHL91504.1 hypothetical protein QW71_34185 [Paenibacillus sp. IHB B 3415]
MKYISNSFGWLPRELAQNYKDMNVQYDKQKDNIHQVLKDRYLFAVTESLLKLGYKELYEVLNQTPGLGTHNTYPTFRKHMNKYGSKSALRGIDSIDYLKSLIHLITFFKMGLAQEEEALIEEWELTGEKKREYLKSHSVAPAYL